MYVPLKGKRPMSHLNKSSQRVFLLIFLFYLDLQLTEWAPPTVGREISFTLSTDSTVNLIQNTLTDTHGMTFDQIAGMVKLTHETNYQNMLLRQKGKGQDTTAR